MGAKESLAKNIAGKKPAPKPPTKGGITDQIIKKYGPDYGKTAPGSKKWTQMANDTRFD